VNHLHVLTKGPFNLRTWPLNEDEHAIEAWERMIYGGATVREFAPFLTLHVEWIERTGWIL
jgi:hypothetical protein